jgi:hypothetical protein
MDGGQSLQLISQYSVLHVQLGSSWHPHLTFHPTVLRTTMLSVCYLGMQSKLENREQYFSYCSL